MVSNRECKISIIIPSYNRSNTVSKTIQSIIDQNFNNDYEIIIGDDLSTDNTREILNQYQAKYPKLIKLIFHKENIGLGANWATCAQAANGKYICNCDNDDYWHNTDKLQIQFDYMEANPDENVIFTNYRNHNRNKGSINEEIAWIDSKPNLQQAFISGNYRICNATVMYRANFMKNHVCLDDYIKYKFTLQDWNTWIILSAFTHFTILPISTATFGIETESITRPSNYDNVKKRFNKERECYKYVCNLFPNKLSYSEIDYDIYVNGVLLNLAYKKRDYSSAKAFSKTITGLGGNGTKVRFANNFFTFHLYTLLTRLKKASKNLQNLKCFFTFSKKTTPY